MSKALAIDPDIGLREILNISQSNDFDVVYNPMLTGPGNVQGGTFIKPAPMHEGASTTFDEPDALPGDATVRGLKDFQSERNQAVGRAENHEDMCVVQTEGGDFQLMPYASGLSMEVAGTGEVVDATDGGVPLDAAIDVYTQQSGQPLKSPTVY